MQPGSLSKLLVAEDGNSYMVFLPPHWTPPASCKANDDQSLPSLVETADNYPLMLFLHGAGGVKNEKNIRGISLGRMLSDPEFASRMEMIIILPVASQRGWQDQFSSLLSLLDTAIATLGADPQKVYLSGQSMGGNGAWELAASHPQRFAALVPICGYWDKATVNIPGTAAEALMQTPIWVFHSVDDSVVSVAHSDNIVASLKNAGNEQVVYTRYERAPPCVTPGGDLPGHGSYELAFNTPELYSWMLGNSLKQLSPPK